MRLRFETRVACLWHPVGVALLWVLPAAVHAQIATLVAGDIVQPNANLVVQGIPDVPRSLMDKVAAYTDFRGHNFFDWHPQRREMLLSHRSAGASTSQLFRLAGPMQEPELMTQGPDPVSGASYEPRRGAYVVFSRSKAGSEVSQLYRLDAPLAEPVLLTDPNERNEMGPWLRRAGQLLYTSVPLDRTAKAGRREQLATTLWRIDPRRPDSRRQLARLEGVGWDASSVSRDDRYLTLIHYISATETQLWLMDLRTGSRRKMLPAPGREEPAAYFGGDFSRDGRQLWVVTDQFSEFRELAVLDLRSGKLQRVSGHIPWDIDRFTLSPDGREVVTQVNVEGRTELRRFDTGSLKELPPPPMPAGRMVALRYPQWDRAQPELLLGMTRAQGPSQLYTWRPGGSAVAWTRPYMPAGIDASQFSDQQVVRWKSFDGLTISGLLSMPPARFAGPRPVLIHIHGGPEAQAEVGFLGRSQYYVQELGVAVLQPNVRGSSGFGKTFLTLDNGYKREDSVKDIGALLDWIATQPQLDASRVMVIGGSYGGYVSLAVATHYADRIAGAIDEVGISHFVTFLQNTESYRRDLRRVEYGDERDEKMREFLHRISPLTNAHKITKPLFVVQGRNDPRVPYTEAEQIVAKVRENGTPVWYLRAENEGHGFARKENADYNFYATVLFVQRYLMDGPAGR